MRSVDEPGEAREVSCFVIGPIGDKDAPPDSEARLAYEDAIQVLEEVIQPACRAFGIEPVRADQVSRTGEIPEQIFRALRDSHLVIADLTGGNPNVMYELGLRHTTGKLTIQLGERGRLPFDVAAIRTILFRRTEAGLVEARRRLTSAIADALDSGGDPVAATRVWFETSVPKTPSVKESETSPTDEEAFDEEPGFLEKLAEMSDAMDSLSLNLDSLTAVMHEINGAVNESTSQINEINAAGANPSARLSVTNRLAQKLEEPASRLEVLVGDYRQTVSRMHPGMMYALAEAKARSDDASSEAFRQQVREFIAVTDSTWPILQSFRDVLLTAGEAARSLRRVNRRITSAPKRDSGGLRPVERFVIGLGA
ncbi:MAG TPA: hypothetical protein VE974_11140 [Thermoanaerobaculia bacterium]|nr:hypothetical protein [Thermoanaerobaculia bacterium]